MRSFKAKAYWCGSERGLYVLPLQYKHNLSDEESHTIALVLLCTDRAGEGLAAAEPRASMLTGVLVLVLTRMHAFSIFQLD